MVLQQEQIPFQLLHNTKSKKHIWIRDYMPIQLEKDKFLRYVYNPDYLADDTSYIPDYFNLYNKFNHDYLFTDIVLDGGNVIKCGDKVIMTDKIFKENPNYGSDELISTLEDLLQSQLIIIPWDKYEIYGHADGMVRFINGNTVLLNNYINFDTDLRNLLLAVLNNHFDVKELKYDVPKLSKLSWAYINFLHIGAYIIVPGFGIPEDDQALEEISRFFQGCKTMQIKGCESLVKDGGALNCISWNIYE